MILGLVGAERTKFTMLGVDRAVSLLYQLIEEYKPEAISSGRCHLGGVDVWAETVAKIEDCYREELIFPAKRHTWEGEDGFAHRNIKIAQHSDVVVCIAVDQYPDTFTDKRYPCCYHCRNNAKSNARALVLPRRRSSTTNTSTVCSTESERG